MAIRRRQYVVHRPIQFGYAGIVIWMMLNMALVVGAVTYFTTLNGIIGEIERAGTSAINVYAVVAKVNGVLAYRIIVLFLALIVVAGLFEIFFLHRIVGPIHAIERKLTDTAGGAPFSPIHLRKKDYFQGLADVVNRLMTRNSAREDAISALLAEAETRPELAALVERVREADK
jgi:hypothetical protein